jgi:hypothetical protein
MPDEVIKPQEGGEGTPKPKEPETDLFGVPRETPGAPKPKSEEKGDDEEKKDRKNEPAKDVDIENHPIVQELRKQVETIKNDYGTNLSGQRKVIDTLQKQLKELQGGKAPDNTQATAPFKEIKRSKDLSKDERESMTEAELRQMDAVADLQETINGLAGQLTKKEIEAKEKETEQAETRETNRNETVRGLAKKIAEEAGGGVDLANQIIDSYNLYDQSKIGDAQVEEFVKRAATLVPDYKPPKEQPKKQGSAVKAVKDEDPFGIDKIVEDVHSSKDGGYAL